MKMFIDIETGGLNKLQNPICEIGALITNEDNIVVNVLNFLIKPYENIGTPMTYEDKAMEIHGISTIELEEEGIYAEDAARFLCNVITAFDVDYIVGHNIRKFDMPFLKEFVNQNYLWGKPNLEELHIIDTMEMAKEMGYEKTSLKYICEQDNINYSGDHRAIEDATSTMQWYINTWSVKKL